MNCKTNHLNCYTYQTCAWVGDLQAEPGLETGAVKWAELIQGNRVQNF